MFTETDIALVTLAHDTLKQVLAEKRAAHRFFPPSLDAQIAAIGKLRERMAQANLELACAQQEAGAVKQVAHNAGELLKGSLGFCQQQLAERQREVHELEGQLLAARAQRPYDAEPDAMLDWIERSEWADVRLAIAPAARTEHGSLRDAIRHAMKQEHYAR